MSIVITVPLIAIEHATPRSRLLTLDLHGHALPFVAGQAVMAGGRGRVRRPYSIACSPEQAAACQCLQLLVGVDASGSAGPHLGSPEPGLQIDIEGPMGSFVFPERTPHRRVLFVAGGTGIAPLRAMMDHAMRDASRREVALLYSARTADEFAFIQELREHVAAGRLELHQTVTRENGDWSGGRGRIGRAHFEAVLHDPSGTLCFACGPPAMVSEAVATLAGLGVPQESIRTEEWIAR